MKNFLSLSILSILFIFSSAQPTSGGPDNFGYTFKTSQDPSGPVYSWLDITQVGTQISGLADDNFVGPFSINNFPFYSSTPTQFYVGSNGYVSFSPGNIASTGAQFPAIPTSGGTNNFIAAMLTDLNFSGSGNPAAAYYYTSGDTVCITFEKVPFWTNNTATYSGLNTFQVILNKADSSITINYKTQIGLPDPTYTTNFVSMGIENGNGTDGLQFWRSNSFPPDTFSVKYYYPNIIQPITDLSVSWTNNERNGGMFLRRNQNFTPSVNVKNTGNQNVTSSITVGYQLLDTARQVISVGSKTISSLNAGDDSIVQFTNSFSVGKVGYYNLETYIQQVSGDNITINDTNKTLVKVLKSNNYPLILDYTDQTPTFSGISWSGGNAGVGVYIEPPFYPAEVIAANYFIVTAGTMGFHSMIYDDNARGGGPGTLLDSAFISSTSISNGAYYRDSLRNSVIINSGGVYLHWLMDSVAITLGRTFTSLPSRHTYEVIGGAWSTYRDADTQDFMMNIEVQPLSVGIQEINNNTALKAYPNPSQNFIDIELEMVSKQALQLVKIYDMQGRELNAKVLNLNNKLRVFKGELPQGQYFIRVGEQSAKVQFID
tara:strand:+ start:4384 stop:6186 length:1803 start_codon:yes stop_codon:yes gene_type:complete